MAKQTYWIADVNGVKAKVVGADARDEWVKVHGWSETTEPEALEFQWVMNLAHGGKGVMNHTAAELHRGLGWVPSGPESYVEPGEDAPAEPTPRKSAAPIASGDTKE
jgi:hypothetical protein